MERNFLCQTGDPTGTGKGGESVYGYLSNIISYFSIKIKLFFHFASILYGEQARYYEAEQVPILKHTKAGLLSMVNVGDNMY